MFYCTVTHAPMSNIEDTTPNQFTDRQPHTTGASGQQYLSQAYSSFIESGHSKHSAEDVSPRIEPIENAQTIKAGPATEEAERYMANDEKTSKANKHIGTNNGKRRIKAKKATSPKAGHVRRTERRRCMYTFRSCRHGLASSPIWRVLYADNVCVAHKGVSSSWE